MSPLSTPPTAVCSSHPAPDRRLMDPIGSADSGKGLASAHALYGCCDVGIGCRRLPMRAVELSNGGLIRPRLPRKVLGGDTGPVTAYLVRCVAHRVPVGWWGTHKAIQHHTPYDRVLTRNTYLGVVGRIRKERPQNATVGFPRRGPVNNRLKERCWVTVASRTSAEGVAILLPAVIVGHAESTHPNPYGVTAATNDAYIVGHVASSHAGSYRFTHCTNGGMGVLGG